MKYFLLLVLALTFLFSSAKDNKYQVSAIPENLLKNADAVIRDYIINKKIITENWVETNEKIVITIFNKSGHKYAHFYEYYDLLSNLSNYKINLYNAEGELIDKSKPKDFKDEIAFSGYSLYDDSRLIYKEIFYDTYPFTVEIEFKKTDKQTLFLGNWLPVPNYEISVENASFSITTSNKNPIKYKEANLSQKVKIETNNDKTKYSWEINNFPAQKREPFSPYFTDIFPNVKLAPINFSYDGSKGSLDTWKEYGKWDWSLIEGRDELSKETVLKIKELVSEAKTDLEKIKILYEYLQNNTRYVSIQLGIGGFQPFEAKMVDKTGYGDCKALSNYMKALLKSVNIDSKYTSIYSGTGKPIDLSFPSQQFNHIILCVPNNNDTVWLECTSQKIPFGVLGANSYDKHVLLVDENGGKIVKTPSIDYSKNIKSQNLNIKLDEDGNCNIVSNTLYNSLRYEEIFHFLSKSKEDQKKSIYRLLNIPDFTIDDFNFSHEQKYKTQKINMNIEASINHYATKNGNRLMVPLNPYLELLKVPKKLNYRKHSIHVRSGYTNIDSVIISMPKEFELEYKPENKELKNNFGSYSTQIKKTDNLLIFIRKLNVNKGNYPSKDYNELRDFIKKINQTDKEKIVLIKKT